MRSLVVFLLLITHAWGQGPEAEKIKETMLKRVDRLLVLVTEARENVGKKQIEIACGKIGLLFEIYPDHLKSVGGYMDLFHKNTIFVKDEALSQLIFFHRTSLECSVPERMNLKQLEKKLKEIGKSLEKQKKIIKKSDTDYENSFYYEYEF
jgi:hypothetical protein